MHAHVQACAACAGELALLGGTREQLAAWTPPDAQLGFSIAREAAPEPTRLAWWRQPSPVWMQAVAATLVFGAGLTVGMAGGANDAPAPASSASVVPAVSHSDLAGLEQRLREEMARLGTASATPVAVRTDDTGRDEALLRRVRTLLTDSEERQRKELALRTAQLLRDVEVQRKVDMAQVQQNLGQLQGTTGAELRQQREMWNLLMNNASLRGGAR